MHGRTLSFGGLSPLSGPDFFLSLTSHVQNPSYGVELPRPLLAGCLQFPCPPTFAFAFYTANAPSLPLSNTQLTQLLICRVLMVLHAPFTLKNLNPLHISSARCSPLRRVYHSFILSNPASLPYPCLHCEGPLWPSKCSSKTPPTLAFYPTYTVSAPCVPATQRERTLLCPHPRQSLLTTPPVLSSSV